MATLVNLILFQRLRDSLTRLAADGDMALAQLPEGCCKPDELALDFHYDCEALLSNFASQLSAELVAALANVNAAFANIPGDGWSEVAVRSAPEWAILRQKARLALEQLEQENPET